MLQWIVIDSKVYDITRFKNLHPGGSYVFMEEDIGTFLTHLLPILFQLIIYMKKLARTRQKPSTACTGMRS